MSDDGGAVEFRAVGKVYDPIGARVVALEDVSFSVGAREFCSVVGPSGCGKTTLLNAVAGFDTITSGEIRLDDATLAGSGVKLNPGPDRIVVFQHGALFPWRTVLWNVACGPVMQGVMTWSQAQDRARELLEQVGLRRFENQYPGNLSGGQKRRVEVLRGLINEPKILLFDEPLRALDALTKSVVQERLLEIYDLNPRTCLFITHDLDEAIFLADRVVVMTTRPGMVKKEVRVNLPRPRTHEMLADVQFADIRKELGELIHEEAKKSFEAGELELA